MSVRDDDDDFNSSPLTAAASALNGQCTFQSQLLWQLVKVCTASLHSFFHAPLSLYTHPLEQLHVITEKISNS